VRIAVFGDSILWGQGLRTENKIATGVQRALASSSGGAVDLVSFAHSGADVWNDGETPIDLLNPLPAPLVPLGGVPPKAVRDLQEPSQPPDRREHVGEIPLDVPYSLREVDRAAMELAGSQVDLALVDAGINDVNVAHIVLPYTSRHALQARTLSIADRARALLELVHQTFPAARIVVTGYYAIVSPLSHVERLLQFAARFVRNAPEDWRHYFGVSAHQIMLDYVDAMIAANGHVPGSAVGFVHPQAQALLLEPLKQRMVDLSATFAASVHLALQEQVALFNAANATDAVLAIPDIPAEHAILTDDPWIFGLDDVLEPQDEVVVARQQVARELTSDPFKLFIWDRASVGHPNVAGARAYVDAILRTLG
jgi:hypothetical protein